MLVIPAWGPLGVVLPEPGMRARMERSIAGFLESENRDRIEVLALLPSVFAGVREKLAEGFGDAVHSGRLSVVSWDGLRLTPGLRLACKRAQARHVAWVNAGDAWEAVHTRDVLERLGERASSAKQNGSEGSPPKRTGASRWLVGVPASALDTWRALDAAQLDSLLTLSRDLSALRVSPSTLVVPREAGGRWLAPNLPAVWHETLLAGRMLRALAQTPGAMADLGVSRYPAAGGPSGQASSFTGALLAPLPPSMRKSFAGVVEGAVQARLTLQAPRTRLLPALSRWRRRRQSER